MDNYSRNALREANRLEPPVTHAARDVVRRTFPAQTAVDNPAHADDVTATEMERQDRARTDFASRHSPRRITFGEAIHFLKQGNRVARVGWNGKGMHLELQEPDEHSKMTRPYIFMKTADGHLVPWLASQTDVLTDDWSLLV